MQIHWAPDGMGGLLGALRIWIAGPAAGPPPGAVGPVVARLRGIGLTPEWRGLGYRGGRAREWRSGRWHLFRPDRRFSVDPAGAARLALVGGLPGPPDPSRDRRHTLIFGATGTGKTSYLVGAVRSAIEAGRSAVVFDLHGDLCARIVAGLPPDRRDRIVAVDPTGPGPVPGVALFGADPGRREAERAHLLAALRRMGADEHGPYWGFRLDRIFDVFLRLTQEEGGSLRDLFQLLTDPGRREIARARTRSSELARFLDELPGIVKRNPEFLWPAASRLGRIVGSPALLALLDPPGEGLPIGAILDRGGSLFWRLPVGELGPEAATLLTTLLATRIYLGEMARGEFLDGAPARVTMVLDEAQALAPRLLAEMLTEGRKFGLAVLAATQYPDRLEPEARHAAAGSVGTHLFFRSPPAQAAELAPWLGVGREVAVRSLPVLPVGVGWRVVGGPGGGRELLTVPVPAPADPAGWSALVGRDRARFGSEAEPSAESIAPEEEQILLGLLAGECAGRPVPEEEIGRRLAEPLPGGADPVLLMRRLRLRGDLEGPEGASRLSDAGRIRLGYTDVTGATRESAEHRALLLEAFGIFARHGLRLEIVRQGRYDLRLPDARLTWVPAGAAGESPRRLAARLDAARRSWAWRAFGGRNVHLEAEVSGADRPDRIRRDLAKGRDREAHVLFLVSEAARARRIRRVLAAAGLGRDESTVWTL
ncbi:MAG: type IV secretory system conjugative DNA transfer family protein, partial [Thermoplasmata archaeon]